MLQHGKLDRSEFLRLLSNLIDQSYYLQNDPPQFIPEESRACDLVIQALEPFKHRIQLERVEFVEKRSNLIIKYKGANSDSKKCISFVGSHFDVVPANRENWTFEPFKMTTESAQGDDLILKGRGTTDCLGHVALLTMIFKFLAESHDQLNLGIDVYGVMIADEESGGKGAKVKVGVDALHEAKKLEMMINGPVIWLDSADKQPNIGSGGLAQWSLKVEGNKIAFHSGFPNKGVNAIEMANDCLSYIQKRFYEDFPPHAKEAEYGFPCSSSMKPTHIIFPTEGKSLNQIPGRMEIQGDIRLIPFYDIYECMASVENYVQEIQKSDFQVLEHLRVNRGSGSSYSSGKLIFNWMGSEVENNQDPHESRKKKGVRGLACDLNSVGFKALKKSTEKFIGFCKPLADTGTLPLVGDLKDAGFDIQTVGYGLEGNISCLKNVYLFGIDYYHAENEQALLSDFELGFSILLNVIHEMNNSIQ
jgi:acetylornithine deacetylase